MQQKKNKGFTLIELMIVVSIIAILAGISYSLYQESVTKSRRGDAKAALSELSVWMERQYTATGCYSVPDSNGVCTTNAPTLPFTVTPKSGTANYDLTVTVTTAGFTLTATPKSNKPDAKCDALSITNTGVKSETGTGTLADCW